MPQQTASDQILISGRFVSHNQLVDSLLSSYLGQTGRRVDRWAETPLEPANKFQHVNRYGMCVNGDLFWNRYVERVRGLTSIYIIPNPKTVDGGRL